MGPGDAEDLRAVVALMRELGVLEWRGVRLDPSFVAVSPDETEPASAPTREDVHRAYWRRITRSSRSPLPPCSRQCACGAGGMPE